MAKSFVDLWPAVVQTLSKLRDIGVEFSQSEYDKLVLIVQVLQPLEETTKLLSKFDASISMVIPLVAGIMKSLEISPRDHGVITWKRALRDNIEERFADIELNKHYTVATMLDSRYKHYIYRDRDTFEVTKDFLVDKLTESLRSSDPRQV